MTNIKLIVGLGNPGKNYENTRHNAGFWLIDQIATMYKCQFKTDGKFFADICKCIIGNHEIFLVKPQTYMNLSGKSVQAIAQFYKITSEQILVVHDELDFDPSIVKLKLGGGNGGHNGLKDIDRTIGKNYWRIRIGIGHPGDKNKVADYVLKNPNLDEKILILNSIDKVINNLELAIGDHISQAMKNINTQ